MRQAAKVDKNQVQLVAAYRGLGCSVEILSRVGHGCPDLLVGMLGVSDPVEIKWENGKLTPDQVTWHDDWRGSLRIVRTVEEVGVHVKDMKLRAKFLAKYYKGLL